MPFTSGLMPVFAKDVLHAGPNGLGLLLSSFGVGAVVGTFSLASMGNIRKKGALLFAAAGFAGVGMMLLSQTRWLPLSALTMALVGASHIMYKVTNNTILQTLTPDEYRGRVMSIYLLDHALVPLGSFLAGSIAEFLESPAAILTGGIIDAALILLVIVRFKALIRITV
jgi:predicted MFS family arabinose efflux permease